MCGIFGFATSDARATGRIDVKAALGALAHRGPDDQGRAELAAGELRCTLAQTRLSILDLSPTGRQPMSTPDGRFTLVYNGEVYNYAELRAELSGVGVRFRGRSDTEVVLHALARWGRAGLSRLRGMFALALFDREQGSLLLARDRLGVKPLYVTALAGGLAFASELRALLDAGAAERRLSRDGLLAYLAFGSLVDPLTIVAGVRALEPGTWLELRDGRKAEGRYWDLPTDGPLPHLDSFEEAREELARRLETAVRTSLVSDVPLGVFLSGGIDSSALVALAARTSSRPVHTFTVSFDEKAYDEARFAADVASRFGCEHHQIQLSAARAAAEMGRAVAALDQPSADGVNTYFVAQAARAHGLKVALSGTGGDELFAGYANFRLFGRLLGAARAASLLPAPLRWPLSRLQGSTELDTRVRKTASVLESGGRPADTYAVLRAMFTAAELAELVTPDVALPPRLPVTLPAGVSEGLPDDPVNAYGRLELRNYLPNTLLRDGDAMSMAHGLEIRVPLLDHELVEAALRVPGSLKLREGQNKPLLAAAVPGLSQLDLSRRKMGFTLPFELWFRGPLRPWLEEQLRPRRVAALGVLRPEGVDRVWSSFLRGERYMSHSRVWCLAALLGWCEENRVTA